MDDNLASRGVLYPTRLPSFHREHVTGDLAVFVRWFWIPEWSIPPGRTSRQHLIAYPACNLVVEQEIAGIFGPSTRASYRDLAGTGWAVGALLRPAAIPAFVPDASKLRDAYRPVQFSELTDAIRAAMNSNAPVEGRRSMAIASFTSWLEEQFDPPSEEDLLANRLVEIAETNPAIVKVSDLADELHVSLRTLQRLASKYVGLTPAHLIRRRRLQETAERLRDNPGLDLATLAHELGFADHAHLTKEFRTKLGFIPSDYRHSLPAN